MKKENKIKLIIFCVLAVFIGISVVSKTFQGDTYFTIALGEDILQNGINTDEVLTYHSDFQFYNVRWAFDILIATIYNSFGFIGIYIFTLFVVGIDFLVLYLICYKYSKRHLISLLIIFLTANAISAFYTSRAQIISILIFIIQFYSATELLKTNKKRYYIILTLLPIILVNFHASVFPIYFIFYLPFVAEYILGKSKFVSKHLKKLEFNNYKYYKNLMIIIIINIFEGLISPLGTIPYTMMFQTTFNFSTKMIIEMQPITKGLLFLYSIYIIILFSNTTKIKANKFFMFIGIALMAVVNKRSLLYYYNICGIIVIEQFSNDMYKRIMEKCKNVKKNIKKGIYYTTIALILLYNSFQFYYNINREYIYKESYPIDAVDYMLENIDFSEYNIYNGFGIGAYLEFRGIKAFMDSRAEVYERPFNDTTILEDFYDLEYESMDYEKIFNKHNINLVLIDKKSNLYEKVIKNSDDERLNVKHEDEYFIIYEFNRQ